MTSKQRAYLRGCANTIDAIFQIGKSGITDILLNNIADLYFSQVLIIIIL